MAFNQQFYKDRMFGNNIRKEESEDSENNSYYNQESGTSEDHSGDQRFSSKVQQKESVMSRYNPANPSCKALFN
jgi:hypothetical protein